LIIAFAGASAFVEDLQISVLSVQASLSIIRAKK
jgi:hypothetical protein